MQTQNLLKTRRFLPLFITQFLGAFNDNAFKNAFLIWFTFDVLTYQGLDSPIMVTLAAGIFILPYFLFSATAGQIADKYEKDRITRVVKVAEIALMALSFVFFYTKSIPGLLAILFFMGVHSTFFGPIKYSLLPEHLAENELMNANGLIEAGTFLSILLGTIFGGILINLPYGIEITAISLIVFAIIGWLSSKKIPYSAPQVPHLDIGWNIVKETMHILEQAREHKHIWKMMNGISWFWFVGVIFLAQLPIYTKEIIHGNEHIVTFFLALFSIGIGIGSILCNWLQKGKIDAKFVPLGLAGIAISSLFFVFISLHYQTHHINTDTILTFSEFFQTQSYSYLITLSLLSLSISAGVYIVPLYALIQKEAPLNALSRIVSGNNILNALFMVVASLLTLLLYACDCTVIDIFITITVMNIPFILLSRNLRNDLAALPHVITSP